MSQENVSDKVRNLQRQIAQGIKFGQRPPSLRRSEGDEGSSDEEEVPRSPLKVLAQVEAEPLKAEPQDQGAQPSGPHSPPAKSQRSKRVLSPTGTIESVNLDAVPQSVPRLDNAAAKHKLAVKPKNQRVSRKHRRFTQELQAFTIPDVVQEDLEAAGDWTDDQRRASDEDESFKKQRLHEEEKLETKKKRELEVEESMKKAEEQTLRELEEEGCRKQQQEEEEKRRREEEDRRIREEKERRQREEEESMRMVEEEKRMREDAERRQREEEGESQRLEEQRRKEEEERERQEEEERMKQEENERLKQEESKRQEEEERMKQEEEEKKRREEERLKQEEEEMKRREEEERLKQEEEERKRREEEERLKQEEEERKRREEEERLKQEEEETKRREEEERLKQEEEERKKREEEEERRKQEEEARKQRELQAEKKRKLKQEKEERKKQEEANKLRVEEKAEKKKMAAEERMRKEEEQRRMSMEEADESSDPQERKRRAEELRWKEMEERQRPFTFKVSSGEKQILFQKVNLTPVTPASSHQSAATPDQREGAKASSSSEGADSPNLPTSPYVPHTAILVTGAQLCGTAVNLDQIKDTACKSLLGLGEDRKAQGTPTKSKTSPDRKSGKTKSLNESALTTDQSSAAVLAEWASIRSKIFKGVEDGKYDEYPEPSKNQSSEDQPPFGHTNLRKTMSATAKFSITPAKKKFGDSNRNSEVFGPDDKETREEAPSPGSPPAASPAPASKPQNRTSKTVRIAERGSEECVFAKDLPSFLVPSPGSKLEGGELKSRVQIETEASESRGDGEERGQDGEDKPSPFGIKLRRTNYSLRFHSEQSTEKRKKRYSAGDSFDGVPSPLTPIEPDSDTSSVFSDKSSPASPQKEGAVCKYLHASASPAVSRAKPGKSTSPTPHSEGDKVLSRPPLYRRPTTSSKPTVPTPPPSPLPKLGHCPPSDDVIQRTGVADSCGQDQATRSEDKSAVAQLHRSSHGQVPGEEEPKEKKSFFPSINIPWREKADRKTELTRKEKPSLQSRHSLDSAKVQEKEAGPLWITLALQKQKGFREQQQSREERRSLREAKLAEKQNRDRDSVTLVSPTESRGSGSTSPSSKPQTPEELKRPDTLLGRFDRRDHLKKANTLPSSVTVEIADSTPSPPAVKEVSKRFPSSDSPQVSTEPAWLALAKRKAKAWSDCPQIIK
ncbi:capping protein inhibiting regulator of actin dynamics isoform X2 [Mugil cephalus]|uniref:capping protein inhibiting regulator of actin dynamics isoform X2 n=1 Tax=Mugil cephalus TaxID=48193 RepID=UPI001FB73032|nr:capping protein inhibiting regulator of actin dynamics isoform X2 [Mugil cephalus]